MHTTHSGSGTEHLGTRGTWFVWVDALRVTQLCQNTEGRKMTGCIIMINQNSRRILSMSQNGRQHSHLRSEQKFWTERQRTVTNLRRVFHDAADSIGKLSDTVTEAAQFTLLRVRTDAGHCVGESLSTTRQTTHNAFKLSPRTSRTWVLDVDSSRNPVLFCQCGLELDLDWTWALRNWLQVCITIPNQQYQNTLLRPHYYYYYYCCCCCYYYCY